MQYEIRGGYYGGFSQDEIFFIEACIMLCFGLLMKRLLVTQVFSYCRPVLTQSQGHFNFLCCPASEELGRDITRTTDPNWPEGHPYSARLSNESWGREGRGRER